MRGALVRDNVVENIVEYGEGWEPDDGTELVTIVPGMFVGPGFTRDGDNWLPPGIEELPEPEPDPVEQMRADLDWLINFVVTGEA